MSWSNEVNIITKTQAGFRKGYSTIDHLYTLNTILYKYLRKKRGRLYCVFVDFRKAFDLINREKLWFKLGRLGIKGNFINVLKNYYDGIKSCVKSTDGCTKLFNCEYGLRQGCNLSPQLFALYINDMVNYFFDNNIRGIQIEDIRLNCLMYADDIVLLADTPLGLQKLLNALSVYCDMWDLEVNIDKTKALVFRNGGITKKNERWVYKESSIETVPYYNYLGLKISSRGSWSVAADTLANQANKGLFKLNSYINGNNYINAEIKLFLFDTMVMPILVYGCEIWGSEKHKSTEKVHTKFCKNVLGISYLTNNDSARAELGRFPVWISIYKKMFLLA